jgi:chromosome segregation ATPase
MQNRTDLLALKQELCNRYGEICCGNFYAGVSNAISEIEQLRAKVAETNDEPFWQVKSKHLTEKIAQLERDLAEEKENGRRQRDRMVSIDSALASEKEVSQQLAADAVKLKKEHAWCEEIRMKLRKELEEVHKQLRHEFDASFWENALRNRVEMAEKASDLAEAEIALLTKRLETEEYNRAEAQAEVYEMAVRLKARDERLEELKRWFFEMRMDYPVFRQSEFIDWMNKGEEILSTFAPKSDEREKMVTQYCEDVKNFEDHSADEAARILFDKGWRRVGGQR